MVSRGQCAKDIHKWARISMIARIIRQGYRNGRYTVIHADTDDARTVRSRTSEYPLSKIPVMDVASVYLYPNTDRYLEFDFSDLVIFAIVTTPGAGPFFEVLKLFWSRIRQRFDLGGIFIVASHAGVATAPGNSLRRPPSSLRPSRFRRRPGCPPQRPEGTRLRPAQRAAQPGWRRRQLAARPPPSEGRAARTAESLQKFRGL